MINREPVPTAVQRQTDVPGATDDAGAPGAPCEIEVQWEIAEQDTCPSEDQIQQWVALALASEERAVYASDDDAESRECPGGETVSIEHNVTEPDLTEPVLTVRIVSSEEIRRANHQWRGIDKATNVLSFPSDFPIETGLTYFGDMLICADVLARESAEQGKALHAHWAHIVIHGTLHLLGYDHIDAADAEVMERREIEILATLGLENPYLAIGEAEIPLSEVSKS